MLLSYEDKIKQCLKFKYCFHRQELWILFSATPCHLGTRECNLCWSGLIWSNPSSETAAAGAICPRSLWKCFSGTTILPLREIRQYSMDWVRKEFLCMGKILLFSQLTQSPNWLRCRSTRSLWSHNCFRVWTMLETVENPDAHFT